MANSYINIIARQRGDSLPSPIAPLVYKKDQEKEFLFPPELRQYHAQVLGTPGGGKTKFLEECLRQDILQKHGLLLFDPAGNLYNDIVKWCVEEQLLERRNIVLLDPNDAEFTFFFNPLEVAEIAGETQRVRQTKLEHVVDATILAIGAMQGGEDPDALPEYNRIMRLILHVLAENGLTLCDSHIFTQHARAKEREVYTEQSGLQGVREDWREINSKTRIEFDILMKAPRNRFARFHSASLSCIVGHAKSTFQFRDAMDSGKAVLVNLSASESGLTATEATILGRLLLNNLRLKAGERFRVDGKAPRPFYCYIDECDLYLNNDVAKAIDKLRQFGLRMILSHQSINQLDDAGTKVRGAVLGSAAIKVYFNLTAEDAAIVCKNLYSTRIDIEKTMDKMDKPVLIGHTVGHLHGSSEGEGYGEGMAQIDGTGSGTGMGIGQVMHDGGGFFGMGEFELSHSVGESASNSFFNSVAQSQFYSKSTSRSVNETLIPELAYMPTQTISSADQLMEKEHYLSHMPPGHCVIGLPHAVSFDAVVKFVIESVASDRRLFDAQQRYFTKRPEIYASKEEVFKTINAQKKVAEDTDDDDYGGLS